MTMATIKRVVIYYLLLEVNHDNGNNKESSNLLFTTGVKS
jgi:NADH/NAD ratio-sensing transcriptional regulator Rex